MTRLDIDADAYDSAAASLVGANQLAARYFNALTGDLGSTGAMAGDDSTSQEFASQYDESAQLCVDGLAHLVDAYANLAELTAQSGSNHRSANGASVYGASEVYGESGVRTDEPVTVRGVALPSSLGGDSNDTPDFWDEILAHLEGFAWPNAETDRLRGATAIWDRAADAVGRLTLQGDIAISWLEKSESPEIPLATAAIRELNEIATDLSSAFTELGGACDDYAGQVEEHREVIKGIVQDMAIEAGISLVAGAIVGFFSFGAGAAGGAAIAGWRITSAARKILSALRKLKAVQKARAVARLEKAGSKLSSLRAKLKKFIDAKKLKLKQKLRGKPGTPLKPKNRPGAAGKDWDGRVANNGKGEVWQKPGSTGNADQIRVGDPTSRYPDGYVRYYNEHGQPIGLDGKTGPNSHTHIPIRPDGTYDVPKGWKP